MEATQTSEQVLEELYHSHGQRLWRAIFASAGDRTIADDSVAEAFAQALHRGGDLRDPLAWIWRVAFRIAAGQLKDRRSRTELVDDVAVEDPSTLELIQALSRLSPKQRAAILLRHYAGYRTDEVARILGSSPGAVRVHVSIGRRRLRSLMEEVND